MELFVTIIFLLLLGSVLSYYSFREINWYFKKEEQKEELRLHVRKIIIEKGYEIISIRESHKTYNDKNPFRNGLKFVLPAFFGAGERYFYWIICYQDMNGSKKEVWAEVKQSVFVKPKYRFSSDII